MAKPLANGYPIGAVLLRDNIASTMTAGKNGNHIGSLTGAYNFWQALTGRHSGVHRWHAQLAIMS
jgi:hypothetical protein